MRPTDVAAGCNVAYRDVLTAGEHAQLDQLHWRSPDLMIDDLTPPGPGLQVSVQAGTNISAQVDRGRGRGV